MTERTVTDLADVTALRRRYDELAVAREHLLTQPIDYQVWSLADGMLVVARDALAALEAVTERPVGRTVTDLRKPIIEAMVGDATYWPDSAEKALDEYVPAVTGRPDGTVTDLETTALEALTDEWSSVDREAVAAVRELARQLDAAYVTIGRIAEAAGEPKPGQLLHERVGELARRATAKQYPDGPLSPYDAACLRADEAEADRDRYREALEQIVARLQREDDPEWDSPSELDAACAALATPDTPPDAPTEGGVT